MPMPIRSPRAARAEPTRGSARSPASRTSSNARLPDRGHAADDGAAGGDAGVRARDGRGGYGHDLARGGVSVVAQARDGGAFVDRRRGADGARDEAADD